MTASRGVWPRATSLLAVGALLVLLPAPATSPAADPVVARGSAHEIWALDGTVVYSGAHGWRRIVKGRTLPARRLPDDDWVSSIGRDRSGRIVLTGGTQPASFAVAGPRWVYDVAADRARSVPRLGLRGCVLGALAFWRTSLAYESLCDSSQAAHLFVRGPTRTRGIGFPSTEPFALAERLVLRGPTLAAIVDEGAFTSDTATTGVWLLADASRKCFTQVPDSFYYADENHGFERMPAGVWLSGGHIMWSLDRWAADGSGRRFDRVEAARLRGGCREPVPVGVPFSPPRNTQAVAIDGRSFYYATPRGIYRHLLPRRL